MESLPVETTKLTGKTTEIAFLNALNPKFPKCEFDCEKFAVDISSIFYFGIFSDVIKM
jgi:hypothetical protein